MTVEQSEASRLGPTFDSCRKDNRAALKTNIGRLMSLTRLLVNEQASLAEAINETPLAVDNLLGAYDPKTGTFDGRGDLLGVPDVQPLVRHVHVGVRAEGPGDDEVGAFVPAA